MPNAFFWALLNSAIPAPAIATTTTTTTITISLTSTLRVERWEYRYKKQSAPVSSFSSWTSVDSLGTSLTRTIINLDGGTPYDIEARTFIGLSGSDKSSASARTPLLPPGPVRNLRETTTSANSIRWDFDPPNTGGAVASYEYRYVRLGKYQSISLPSRNDAGGRKLWVWNDPTHEAAPEVDDEFVYARGVQSVRISHINLQSTGLAIFSFTYWNTLANEGQGGFDSTVRGFTTEFLRDASFTISLNTSGLSVSFDIADDQSDSDRSFTFNNKKPQVIAMHNTPRQNATLRLQNFSETATPSFSGGWNTLNLTRNTTRSGLIAKSGYAIEVRARNAAGVSSAVFDVALTS